MLRGGPALASVFLCFACLLIQKPQVASRCSQDLISRVNSLIQKAPELKSLDSRLYTPSPTDSKQNCPISTLNCFADEIEVLGKEWEKGGERVRSLQRVGKMLKRMAESIKQTELGCRQCEFLQEKDAEKFLNDLLSTLEYLNSQLCIS